MKKPLSLLICFFIPLSLLTGGLSVCALYSYRMFPKLFEESARGEVPPGLEAMLGEPGSYTVWLHEGEEGAWEHLDRTERDLPEGGKLHVIDFGNGRELSLTNWVKQNRNVNGDRSVSLGAFDSTRPGQRVEVIVSGVDSPVLISVGPSNMELRVRIVVTAFGIVALTLMVVIASFLYLMNRRNRSFESAR